MVDVATHFLPFLKDWLHWAETGDGKDDPLKGLFSDKGLCASYGDYFEKSVNLPMLSAWQAGYQYVQKNMFPGQPYPFGEVEYWDDNSKGTMHKSPDRLEWVRNKIKELESE